MSTNTDKQWRVQVRKSRAHKWVNKGLYETRAVARRAATLHRVGTFDKVLRIWRGPDGGVGFGNTRIVPYVKAKKGQGK